MLARCENPVATARGTVTALDDEIRPLGQLAKDLAPLLLFQIERDPAFVCIVGEPVKTLRRAVAIFQKRREPPRSITTRRLNLDHVSAQVAEDFPGQKTERFREIKNAIWSQ